VLILKLYFDIPTSAMSEILSCPSIIYGYSLLMLFTGKCFAVVLIVTNNAVEWRFGIMVMALVSPTKLLSAEPG